jgi:hypothetical protein
MLKIILWVIRKLGRAKQKAIVLSVLEDLVNSKDSQIDKAFGELVVATVIKSTGNNITAFIVKD